MSGRLIAGIDENGEVVPLKVSSEGKLEIVGGDSGNGGGSGGSNGDATAANQTTMINRLNTIAFDRLNVSLSDLTQQFFSFLKSNLPIFFAGQTPLWLVTKPYVSTAGFTLITSVGNGAGQGNILTLNVSEEYKRIVCQYKVEGIVEGQDEIAVRLEFTTDENDDDFFSNLDDDEEDAIHRKNGIYAIGSEFLLAKKVRFRLINSTQNAVITKVRIVAV